MSSLAGTEVSSENEATSLTRETETSLTKNETSTTGAVISVPETETSTSLSTTKTITEKTTSASTYEYAYAGFNPQPANFDIPDWRLLLVNRDYILPEGYVPDELVPAVSSDPDSKKLVPEAAEYYNKMYQAAKEDGITLTTVSGYRSYERQKTNFENKISYYENLGNSRTEATQKAARVILPPGTSEHNAGLAMDICSLEQTFENTEAFAWLSRNAVKFGFILRYPKDKEDITEIIYEPWHWRYVGVEYAAKIKESGKTLEEYLGVK